MPKLAQPRSAVFIGKYSKDTPADDVEKLKEALDHLGNGKASALIPDTVDIVVVRLDENASSYAQIPYSMETRGPVDVQAPVYTVKVGGP